MSFLSSELDEIFGCLFYDLKFQRSHENFLRNLHVGFDRIPSASVIYSKRFPSYQNLTLWVLELISHRRNKKKYIS